MTEIPQQLLVGLPPRQCVLLVFSGLSFVLAVPCVQFANVTCWHTTKCYTLTCWNNHCEHVSMLKLAFNSKHLCPEAFAHRKNVRHRHYTGVIQVFPSSELYCTYQNMVTQICLFKISVQTISCLS